MSTWEEERLRDDAMYILKQVAEWLEDYRKWQEAEGK